MMESEKGDLDPRETRHPRMVYLMAFCATIGGFLFGYDTGAALVWGSFNNLHVILSLFFFLMYIVSAEGKNYHFPVTIKVDSAMHVEDSTSYMKKEKKITIFI